MCVHACVCVHGKRVERESAKEKNGQEIQTNFTEENILNGQVSKRCSTSLTAGQMPIKQPFFPTH